MLPRGTISQIVAHLRDQSIDINFLDSLFLRFFGSPQSGWIALKIPILTKGDLFFRLTKSKAALKNLTLIPGETLYFFFKQIAVSFNVDEAELWAVCNRLPQCLEGNFVPETYKLPYGAGELDIIRLLLGFSEKKHREFAQKHNVVYGSKEWREVLVKASIIQKEAFDVHEMPLVSAVIYNRLRRKMPLQMDGSLNYGPYSHDRVTPKRIREDQSAFNTYKYSGIPPIPSGSASLDALESALNPANLPYLYFVRTKSGRHYFSETYREHREKFSW